MPLWTTIYSAAFWPVLVLICGISIMQGDKPSKASATALLIGMVTGQIGLSPVTYADLEIGLATADLGLLIAFTWLSIRWGRWWLIALSAIQMLMVLGHAARWLFPPVSRLAYAILTGGGAYLQLALLAFALYLSMRSRARRA